MTATLAQMVWVEMNPDALTPIELTIMVLWRIAENFGPWLLGALVVWWFWFEVHREWFQTYRRRE